MAPPEGSEPPSDRRTRPSQFPSHSAPFKALQPRPEPRAHPRLTMRERWWTAPERSPGPHQQTWKAGTRSACPATYRGAGRGLLSRASNCQFLWITAEASGGP